MLKKYIIVPCLIVISSTMVTAQVARYAETMVSMPTYMFSEPNPVPDIGTIYPYFRFDGYVATASEQQWKMIVMENDYIKLWITPDIGGKIWGAVEKSTGKEFIYFNHTVKFRDIAMRGPWTSGGLEINFGVIGHAPTCSSPVDYLLRTNDDGSVSCFLGAIDLPSRTRWSVEVCLPPDKSYFITRSRWDNSSVTEQSYYQWMNTGVKTAGNLEYVYPGKHYLGHDGQAFSWPTDDRGRAINWYEKNSFGSYKSYHVFGSYTDFFGGYWHDDDFGFGHYARYDDKPGKKIWIWGLSPQGMIWEDLLTDKDGQYSEIQSGRLFNQEASASTFTPFKHRDFAPAATDLFEEYWFPVKGTNGLKYGLPDASLNLARENDRLVLRISPNTGKTTRVVVKSADQIIFSKQINFVPQKPVELKIDSDLTSEACTVWFDDRLAFDGNPAHAHTMRPTRSPETMNWNSAYGHFLLGKEWERQRRYQNAGEEYDKSLSVEATFVPALDGMAHLFFRRGDFVSSREFALNALAVDTYDGAANYYYGQSSLAMGDTVCALDGLSLATTSPDYRSAAYNALAAIWIARKNYPLALDYAGKSLQYNSEGSKARQIQTLAHRLSGQTAQAEQDLARIALTDPLDHICRIERYLDRPTSDNAQAVKQYITNEFPYQTYLEYAIFYYSLGQRKAALQILTLSPSAALADYWLAYLAHLNGDETQAAAALDRALNTGATFVFPYRNETKTVLDWALTMKNHWKTKYYLGLMELARYNDDRAMVLWQACRDVPDFYPFYIARAELNLRRDPMASGKDLKLAMKYGESQWQAGWMAARIYDALGQHEEAMLVSKVYYELNPDNYYLGLEHAGFLNKSGQYAASIDVLKKIHVLPNEGATAGREVWRNSNLNLAIDRYRQANYAEALQFSDAARAFPVNLGVGRTYISDERLEDFISALCYQKMNQPEQAKSYEDKIIGTISDRDEEIAWNSTDLITAIVLSKHNQKDAAEKLMNELEVKAANVTGVRWSMAIFKGDSKTARRIAEEPVSAQVRDDRSYPVLLRLYNECGIFSQE